MKHGMALIGREAGAGDGCSMTEGIGDGFDLLQLMRGSGILVKCLVNFTGLRGIELAEGVGSDVRVVLRVHGRKRRSVLIVGLGCFLGEEVPQLADGVVHDEAHVADGEAGDASDLLVGAIVEEFEPDDLTLVGTQLVHAAPDVLIKLTLDGEAARIGVVARGGFEDFVIAEVEPVVLAEDVEGTIPADGVEPGFEIIPHASRLGEVELEERILHHIAATLDVSPEDAGCVGDEVAFMLVEGTPHQDRGFILVVAF